jgi:copper transport protein
MRVRGRLGFLGLAVATALVLPAAAWAHAALLHTLPEASRTVNTPPPQVSLTYSEAVEPRFAIVSVTDAAGHQQTAGPPRRSPANPNELVVPLRHVPEGWYLVYWRVISADGHPVRGAFTFAVGPNPGPAPQFVIPSTSETAATPTLLVFRWATFLTFMAAIGLFVLRVLIARPAVRRGSDVSLRPLSIAFAVAIVAALVVTPIYVLVSTAKFALRSVFDLGTIIPLARDSAFGRGFLDLELVLALFALAALVTIAIDRPERRLRSTAELLALCGALAAAAAALLVPGLAGHAAQTSPRGLSLALDWLHLAAGATWFGGLSGLLVLWFTLGTARVDALAIVVPRFSKVAFGSVVVLIGAGTGAAVIHLPTLASLWDTSYGKSLVLKVGLLAAALLLAGVNLVRTTPRLAASMNRPELGPSATALLRRTVSGEALLIAGAIFGAALLSSLPPPAKALSEVGKASAHVGPGPVSRVVRHGPYTLRFRFTPNRAAVPNSFNVTITKGGEPVQGADVTTTFAMLDMEMGQLAYHLPERGGGTYGRSAPALVMVGHWGLSFDVRIPGQPPFNVILVDRANG